MKYTQYIVALVAMIFATACTTSDVDEVAIGATGAKSQLQVVGRISQFSDCDVATRSKKDGDEPKVTSMGLALFPIENGTVGNCLYYDYQTGGSIVFIVERSDDVFDNYTDKQFAMYIFANMHDATDFPTTAADGKGKSLDYFINLDYPVTADIAEVPESGFPMIGSLGDNASKDSANNLLADGKKLILKPSKSETNPDGLPTIDGNPTDNLEIPMEALFAKFSFTISVKPDQEIVGNKAPRFDLTGYTVNNIASTVDCDSTTNNDTDVIDTSGAVSQSSYAQGATTAIFDFYLPERFLTPANTLDSLLPDALKKGTYDTVVDSDQNGYRDQDEKYHQRFKPLLPGDSKKATYVTIEGKYTDHQGHTYDVGYDIYLGGNNYDNFDIIRNTHYNNSVTIRGISSSSDQATNEQAISIDHRVTVERSTPLVINLRRESLLDAHFEVRPLRLRLVGENTATSATVQILNEDGTTNNLPGWIRLEKSGTNSNTYITSGVSAGKRKYFTTDLVTSTLASGTTLSLTDLDGNNQTLWIYVDENTDTKSRAAIVRVTYDGVDTDFKIVQNGLYSVTVDNRTYYLEQYEEFLYNYDAEDSYGQTKDEGMPWGLNGVQLSKTHYSFNPDLTPDVNWTIYETKATRPYYDFYTEKHDKFALENGGTVRSYPGHTFTTEIVKNPNSGVKYLTMAESATGAVEYCYNRNKRNDDGTIAAVEWYLPSADELEDFIVAAYSDFEEFQQNYYWTSQPAYIRNIFYYESSGDIASPTVYDDNTEYARATKVVRKDGEYLFALSGLEDKPTPYVDRTHSGYTNLGYFYQMHYWKGRNDYGPVKEGTQDGGDERYTYNAGPWYNPKYYYYIHLGFLYNLTQEGYHPRTKYNRVRCVRVAPTTTTTGE